MLFLLTAYFTVVSGCKYTLFFKNSCIISNNNNKMVYIPDNYIKPANLPVGIKSTPCPSFFSKIDPTGVAHVLTTDFCTPCRVVSS